MKNLTPWYFKDVPLFECQHCGDCCRRPGIVIFSPAEIKSVADFLKIEVEKFILKYGFSKASNGKSNHLYVKGPCPFQKDNNCTIYSVRPHQCRTYPAWPEVLKTPLCWKRHKQMCKGIGQGGSCEAIESMKKLAEIPDEERAQYEALVSCFANHKPGEDGLCRVQTCLLAKAKGKTIEKEGCKIYIISKEIEKKIKEGG